MAKLIWPCCVRSYGQAEFDRVRGTHIESFFNYQSKLSRAPGRKSEMEEIANF